MRSLSLFLFSLLIVVSCLLSRSFGFVTHSKMQRTFLARPSLLNSGFTRLRSLATITDGVEFDTIAREWRFKWSGDNDKKSLQEAQKVLNNFKTQIKGVSGVKSVQRVVCGGCLDYKVVVALPADKFKEWVRPSSCSGIYLSFKASFPILCI
jgi:hypothetical protein